ncbi:hypothetical protein L6452_35215 [Arctium lappa]|uniref:Uncharacterized protein n=1 Tax=Arctium lappa TaxID=4217 RepID=A0ACB8Y6E7_ARCLA|nr:hypothetical protein L6452_35215 [Arctium lappa]
MLYLRHRFHHHHHCFRHRHHHYREDSHVYITTTNTYIFRHYRLFSPISFPLPFSFFILQLSNTHSPTHTSSEFAPKEGSFCPLFSSFLMPPITS